MRTLNKHAVAEAVHRAVCQYTGTNGARKCLQYAIAGSSLLSSLTGHQHVPQIGSLWVFAEEPDGWVEFDINHCGDPLASFEMGEFHAWIATTSSPVPGSYSKGTIIDLSARHFKELAEHSPCDSTLVWTRPEPAKFLWVDNGPLPDWVRLKVDPTATTSVLQMVIQEIQEWRPLLRLVKHQYEEIVRRDGGRKSQALRRKTKKAHRKRLRHAQR